MCTSATGSGVYDKLVVVVITVLYQTLSWFLTETQTPILKELRGKCCGEYNTEGGNVMKGPDIDGIVDLAPSGWFVSSRNSAISGSQRWSLLPDFWMSRGNSS